MRSRYLTPVRAIRLCLFLVALGFAASAYLTVRALDMAGPHAPGWPDLCSALFASGCDAALRNDGLWGMPLAGWGLVYFTALAALLFLGRFMRSAFDAQALLPASLLAAIGVAAGISIVGWALREGTPPCPLCLTIHAVNLVLLVALRQASPEPLAAQLRRVREAWRWLAGTGRGTSERARWQLVGFAGVTLLSALVWQRIYFEAALRRPSEARRPGAGDPIAAYRTAPWNDLPVSGEDPHLGPLSAPVRLVVFESFRCPACRRLAGTISRLRHTFGDRLLVVYKHYPLSTECNGRLTRDLQPGACEAAWAAEAANRQRSFWPFYDALFAADARDAASGIADAARSARLDAARFASDRRSDSTLARVATDIALGDRLQIPGTPAVFVDGRLVPSNDHHVLETLIRHVLDERAAGKPRSSPDVVGSDRPAIRGRSSRGG